MKTLQSVPLHLVLLCAPTASCSFSSPSMAPLDGVTFFQGEGGSLLRTSLSVKVAISFISSLNSLTCSASCHLPQPQTVNSSWPKTAMLLPVPGFSWFVRACRPGSQSPPWTGKGRCPTLYSGVLVAGCSYHLYLRDTSPWGIEMMPSYIWQSLWDTLEWGSSPTLATSLGSLLSGLAMPPTSWDCPGVVWVSLTTQAHHHHQAALSQTGIYLGLDRGWVGFQGLPYWLGTNPPCCQSYQTRNCHPPPWAGSGLLFQGSH